MSRVPADMLSPIWTTAAMHDATPLDSNADGSIATFKRRPDLLVDPHSRRLLADADRMAASHASILLIGETGTGKEILARHVHERSGRTGPFVAVNCGALTTNLGEAALFGHEAGAYTGAVSARAGWFEAANGGTLFLDEVADLPLPLQVALLRVLQEGQVVRLGSRKSITLDVRVVAATNVDVHQAVGSGRFRLDLYFRLSVVTLDLPPLRQRTADILPLAEHFIQLYSARLHQPPPRLDSAARTALLRYSWPGNIRELENVMHAAVLRHSEQIIRPADLRLVPWTNAQAGAKPTDLWAELGAHLDRVFEAGHQRVLERIESLSIQRALQSCGGNQVRTARLLGISRNVLRTFLKRFGLLAKDGAGITNIVDGSPADHE